MGVVRALDRELNDPDSKWAPLITACEFLKKIFFLGLIFPVGPEEGKVFSKVSSSFNLQFFWHNFSSYHITASVYSISISLPTASPVIYTALQILSTPKTFSSQISFNLVFPPKEHVRTNLNAKDRIRSVNCCFCLKVNYLSRVFCLLQNYTQIKYLLSLIFNVKCMTLIFK